MDWVKTISLGVTLLLIIRVVWRMRQIAVRAPTSLLPSEGGIVLHRLADPRPYGVLFIIGALFLIGYLLQADLAITRSGPGFALSGFFLLIGYFQFTNSSSYILTSEAIEINTRRLLWKDITTISADRSLPGRFKHPYLRYFHLTSVQNGGAVMRLSIDAQLKEVSPENLGQLLENYCTQNGNPITIIESTYPGEA